MPSCLAPVASSTPTPHSQNLMLWSALPAQGKGRSWLLVCCWERWLLSVALQASSCCRLADCKPHQPPAVQRLPSPHACCPPADGLPPRTAHKPAGVRQRGQAPDGASVRSAGMSIGGAVVDHPCCSLLKLLRRNCLKHTHSRKTEPATTAVCLCVSADRHPSPCQHPNRSLDGRDARGGAHIKDLNGALLGAHQRVAVARREQRAQAVSAVHGAQAGAGAGVPHLGRMEAGGGGAAGVRRALLVGAPIMLTAAGTPHCWL